MRLYSYVVARDYGFAPNPFFGYCSLATCKPRIRSVATVGDWVIGTGAKTKYGLSGYLLYAMRVDEALDFNTYWSDARFLCKRPILNGSLKQIYGDNIYHRHRGRWRQADSHHSYEAGKINRNNVKRDTSVDRVLISRTFVFYGDQAILIPRRLRDFKKTGEDICCPGQGHRVFSDALPKALVKWLEKRDEWGLLGMPLEFENHPRVTGAKA